MPKKQYFKDFKPFLHENLGWKQSLYKLAQDFYSKREDDGGLASALTYASIADYMGLHLLMSLRYYVKILSQQASGGVIFYGADTKFQGVPISRLIEALNDYSFPMKEEILSYMIAIKDARNHLFHEMALISPDEVGKLDQDVKTIADNTESLINKVDLLYANFPAEGATPEATRDEIENKK